jgi:hypothetical protein
MILQEIRVLWRVPILPLLVLVFILWLRVRGGEVDDLGGA